MVVALVTAAMASPEVSCDAAVCAVLRAERYEAVDERLLAPGEIVEIALDAAPRIELHVDHRLADRVTVELRSREALVIDAGGWSLPLDGLRDAWSEWVVVEPLGGAYPLGLEPAAARPPVTRAEVVDAAAARRGPDSPRWDEIAASCDLRELDPDGPCYWTRVGGEVRVTAWRDGRPVEVVTWTLTNAVGC